MTGCTTTTRPHETLAPDPCVANPPRAHARDGVIRLVSGIALARVRHTRALVRMRARMPAHTAPHHAYARTRRAAIGAGC